MSIWQYCLFCKSTKLKKALPERNPNGVYVVALYSHKSSRKEKLELVKVQSQELQSVLVVYICATFEVMLLT